ncbi:MAG: TSUP family transporter, partial [Planctomycetota bacterium]
MDYNQLFILLPVMFFCAILQSAVGFGFALVCVPAMLLFNFSLPEAVVVTSVVSFFQRIHAVIKLWSHITWKELLPVIAAATITLPLGVYIMTLAATLDKDTLRQYIGILIGVVLIVIVSLKIEPREKIHAAWAYIAGALSGILGGIAAVNGPPLVFWVYAHKWHSEKLRIAILAISLPMFA